jgi:hypothetical protein
VILCMIQTVVNGKERDMEKAIHFWIAGIQGAVAMESQHFFDKALTTYDLMRCVWPGEQRIEELADLIVHWGGKGLGE